MISEHIDDIQQRLEGLDAQIEEHGWEAVHERLKELDWDQVRTYLEQRR